MYIMYFLYKYVIYIYIYIYVYTYCFVFRRCCGFLAMITKKEIAIYAYLYSSTEALTILSSGRTTNSVDIVFNLTHFVDHHVRDTGYVDAAAEHVSAYEHPKLPSAELVQDHRHVFVPRMRAKTTRGPVIRQII